MMKARLSKDHVGYFRGHPQPIETYKGHPPWPLQQRPEKPAWPIQIIMRSNIHEFNLLIELRRAGFVSSMKGAARVGHVSKGTSQPTPRSLSPMLTSPVGLVQHLTGAGLALGSVTSVSKLGEDASAHVRGSAWGAWATRTAITSHFKCHLGEEIPTVKTLARSHPAGTAVAWIKVTGGVLCLPSTIVAAVISSQAVGGVVPRCPADAGNQQVRVWSAGEANVLSWNNS